MKSLDLDEILNNVYTAGYDVAGLRAVGESGGTITSDAMYKAKAAIEAYVNERVRQAEYVGELQGMKDCWNHINVTLNDNQGFVNWYKNHKNAIETAYIPATQDRIKQLTKDSGGATDE